MMKKIVFLLSLFLVFSLSACQDKPFEIDEEGFTFIETDTLSFNFNNGLEEQVLYTYQFAQELKMFVNEDETIYNFRNINNYLETSDMMKDFITSFGDKVSYRTVVETNFDNSFKLSLGATQDDYNLEKVEHDGEVFTEDAFMVSDEGVTVILSYTKFEVDNVEILVPSFIQMFVTTIHTEVSWEFLGETNDYMDSNAKLIHYEQLVVPLPTKTGAVSSFESIINGTSFIDNFTRVLSDSTVNTGIWEVCSSENTTDCINPVSSTLEVQIYEMLISDVIEYYESFFGGVLEGSDIVFINQGRTFILYDMEEVQVRADSGEIIDVVNAKVKLY